MKQFILFFFCLLSLNSFSQLSLAYSGQMAMFSPSSFLPVSDGGYLSVKKGDVPENKKSKSWNDYRKAISFLKYDKNFKLVSEVRMAASGGICSGQYSELKKTGNKFWFIYLEPMDNNDVGNINAVEIDPASLQQKEVKTIAASTAMDHRLRDYRYTMYLDFLCGTSPSGKYIYLNVQLSDNDNFLTCMDENMKPLWGKKEKKMNGLIEAGICSMEVDDAGYLYTGLVHKKGGVFCSIYSPTGQMNRTEVTLSAGKPNEIVFHPVKNSDQVMVTGTYMEDDNCTGVYKGRLSNKGALSSITTTVFPKNIVESMNKEGFASTRAKKFGMHPAFAAVPVRNGDGSSAMNMIMEFRSESGGGATGVSTQLQCGSILYVDFTKAEPVFARVPKYSVSAIPNKYAYNAHYGSGCMYYAYHSESKLILLYFDNPDNLTRDMALDAKVSNPKNQVLLAAVIDKDGNIKRQQVITQSLNAAGIPATAGTMLVPLVINNGLVVASVRL
jgi:hypothetical protein